MAPFLPEDLDGEVNLVNIDEGFRSDNDPIESGSIVAQRYLVFRSTDQIVISQRIELRFREWFEVFDTDRLKQRIAQILLDRRLGALLSEGQTDLPRYRRCTK